MLFIYFGIFYWYFRFQILHWKRLKRFLVRLCLHTQNSQREIGSGKIVMFVFVTAHWCRPAPLEAAQMPSLCCVIAQNTRSAQHISKCILLLFEKKEIDSYWMLWNRTRYNEGIIHKVEVSNNKAIHWLLKLDSKSKGPNSYQGAIELLFYITIGWDSCKISHRSGIITWWGRESPWANLTTLYSKNKVPSFSSKDQYKTSKDWFSN